MPTLRRRDPSRSPNSNEGSLNQGQMTLVEHLRELRRRLVVSVLALVAGAVVGWFLFDTVFGLVKDPFLALRAEHSLDAKLTFSGIPDALILQLKMSAVIGVVLTSPVWLYQLWAFIVPGLHRNERRLTLAFLGSAVPLFLAGVGLAYFILPKALAILLVTFTPEDVSNLVTVDKYLSFVMRLTLAFGIAFELPVFVVMLNVAGVVSSDALRRRRAVVVFAIFLFAAAATPTADPITMLTLALPMWGLYEIAVLICRASDRRRARDSAEPDYAGLSDDEASPLEPGPGPGDEPADR